MAPRKSFEHLEYSLADALNIIGEWWTPLIVWSIAGGSHRFDDIQASLEIARNILADRLQTLVTHEVVERRQYSDRPARFEYHLTERGEELIPVLMQLESWGAKWAMPAERED